MQRSFFQNTLFLGNTHFEYSYQRLKSRLLMENVEYPGNEQKHKNRIT